MWRFLLGRRHLVQPHRRVVAHLLIPIVIIRSAPALPGTTASFMCEKRVAGLARAFGDDVGAYCPHAAESAEVCARSPSSLRLSIVPPPEAAPSCGPASGLRTCQSRSPDAHQSHRNKFPSASGSGAQCRASSSSRRPPRVASSRLCVSATRPVDLLHPQQVVRVCSFPQKPAGYDLCVTFRISRITPFFCPD